MKLLDDKVAVMTGGGGGLGRAYDLSAPLNGEFINRDLVR